MPKFTVYTQSEDDGPGEFTRPVAVAVAADPRDVVEDVLDAIANRSRTMNIVPYRGEEYLLLLTDLESGEKSVMRVKYEVTHRTVWRHEDDPELLEAIIEAGSDTTPRPEAPAQESAAPPSLEDLLYEAHEVAETDEDTDEELGIPAADVTEAGVDEIGARAEEDDDIIKLDHDAT